VTLYAPPAIPAFPAGFGALPATMDSLIQAPLGFLATSIVFRAHQATTQSLTSGTFVTIKYDTIDEDPYGGWSATATGSQSAHSWLAPYTGWYVLEMTYNYTPTSPATWSGAGFLQDATALYQFGAQLSYGGDGGAYILPLIGGTDYIEFQAQINLAGLSTAVGSAGVQPSAEVSFISQ